MRISRHDLRRRYSNSLVIDAGSHFTLRACSQAIVMVVLVMMVMIASNDGIVMVILTVMLAVIVMLGMVMMNHHALPLSSLQLLSYIPSSATISESTSLDYGLWFCT
jgi:hypothetical protein